MSEAKVELGRHLFHDPRLSGNGEQSCATCHVPALAFTDGKAHAIGATGEVHARSAMSLANVAYAATLTWASDEIRALEKQALVPMLNQEPVEMGVTGHEEEVLGRIRVDATYAKLFADAFPSEPVAADLKQLGRALAAFERTIISGRSAFDCLVYDGDTEALSESAWRGMKLFDSDRLACGKCHAGVNFSGPVVYVDSPRRAPTFHDTGLYTRAEQKAGDWGLAKETNQRRDLGKFRAPTLRNIAVTAPYMHDGSVATLDEVIDHYAAGGRATGRNRQQSELVRGFELTTAERRDLVGFLESLTDAAFLADSRFSDPWPEAP